MNLNDFNAQSPGPMHEQLLECCHCQSWSMKALSEAPFASKDELASVCERYWSVASESEILEAFSGHPQIGNLAALRSKYAVTATAEQGQVIDANEETLIRLKSLNDTYLEKFGFIFIVCATGKSAEAMLGLLEARIENTRAEELVNGAREQLAIMKLRLDKLIED